MIVGCQTIKYKTDQVYIYAIIELLRSNYAKIKFFFNFNSYAFDNHRMSDN